MHLRVNSYMTSFLSLAEDDPNANIRSKYQLTLLYSLFLSHTYQTVKDSWTGVTNSGSGYTLGWMHLFTPMTVMAITNSVVAPPNLFGGPWAANIPDRKSTRLNSSHIPLS